MGLPYQKLIDLYLLDLREAAQEGRVAQPLFSLFGLARERRRQNARTLPRST
jgi:hypothetical protein